MNNNKPYFALATVCLVWGTTYLFTKIAMGAMEPLFLAFIRQMVAGALLFLYVWFIKKERKISLPIIKQQAVNGVLMITVGNGFSTWGVKYIPTGVAALFGALVPLLAILFTWMLGKGFPNNKVIFGIFIGLFGIVLISRNNLNWSESNDIQGLIAVILACITWTMGTVLTKYYFVSGSVLLKTSLQMLFGGLFLLPLSLLFDKHHHIQFDAISLGALLYLIVFGSLITFNAFNYALSKLPIEIASLYTYVNPVIALV
ncbi:MAG: EamA family transporter, partial [Saprospiraceae bacterium]